ncbi:CpeR family transcriptional regulator [Alkalinema pantanalense CENA528]|uniref:CpeR family transcriptional regulator n=1 Tax=Alkalinema pantanalense TaxID=1620705 RepID=UPI003D6E6A63
MKGLRDCLEKELAVTMLPPEAEKKLKCWIRSRHLICSGNFFIFQTVDYAALDRFSTCVTILGGTIISVDPIDKIWMGDHRQVVLYQAKASLHTPCHSLKQYWIKYGSFRTRFELQI